MSGLVAGLACVLVPIGVAVLAVLAFVGASKQRAQRTGTLAGYAASREWRFRPDGTGLEQRFAGEPFDQGYQRHVTNVVEGTYEGRPMIAFDYAFRTGGENNSRHQFSVVALHLGMTVPTLQVRPQSSIGRFFSGVFGTDIVIGAPAFDDAFSVRADDPRFAHDVLRPPLVELVLPRYDRAWRLQGDSLLLFRAGEHHPAELDAVLAYGSEILRRVPDEVWARIRGDG